MHISIVGTGYVGLVTGACFSEFGNDVICVDIDEKKIARLNAGEIPIYEPGLEDLVVKNIKAGRLRFSTDLQEAVENSLVIFIAVGTPAKEDGSADMQQIEKVAKEIARHLSGYKVIVNKSTAPVGTGKWLEGLIRKAAPRAKFGVVSNPEFLREGSAIEDFMRPNRVVIGSESPEAIAIMKELYSPLYLIETPFVVTNLASAELIKYASNAFLATKISFINEMANFCEIIGADVHHVAKGMGLDNRIGRKFLHPGPGFGGSCFPKDTAALVQLGQDHDFTFEIVQAAVRVNEQQALRMLKKIRELVGTVEGKTFGMLGLAFKPNTDDIREAPSLKIIDGLVAEGARVRVYDPAAMANAKQLRKDLEYCEDTYEVARDADALVLVTEWNQFRSLDLDRIKQMMKSPVVIDLRNVYNPEKMIEKGFSYTSVGRPETLFK
ncbi:MAG: UDP-glucose/GDP-mannose dehydrogenase family protein [Calditrichaeota bacterium]|nr:MAG: UDP-glucose/GDP-mannose dehydrogenase family protein [Calditrichota bacterium]